MVKNRRTFLKAFGGGALAMPLSGLIHQATALAAETPKLSLDNASAKALGYTHNSTIANKQCVGCQLYTGEANAKWGSCPIFAGYLVSATGYCNSWNARA